MSDDVFQSVMNLYGDPSFRRMMAEFFVKMQQEGVEAAKALWEKGPEKDMPFSRAVDLWEQVTDSYAQFGFVPGGRHQEALKENKTLREENEVLKNTIRELKHKLFVKGGAKVQEAWREAVEEQVKLGVKMGKDFFDLFGLGGDGKK